jgi:hypothetical protein
MKPFDLANLSVIEDIPEGSFMVAVSSDRKFVIIDENKQISDSLGDATIKVGEISFSDINSLSPLTGIEFLDAKPEGFFVKNVYVKVIDEFITPNNNITELDYSLSDSLSDIEGRNVGIYNANFGVQSLNIDINFESSTNLGGFTQGLMEIYIDIEKCKVI